jgi:hypothetical protein
MWLASYYMLVSWSMAASINNYWNSGKSAIDIDSPSLEPVVKHSMVTPSSTSIVLTLDVSASMEYKVRISTTCVPVFPAKYHAFSAHIYIFIIPWIHKLVRQ